MNYSAIDNLIQHVSLRQLQIFETVVRLNGYTRAAKVLHLTQPTVSMQVKKLSETIGYPLVKKVGNRIHTTAAGDKVYASAQHILGSMVSLGESIAEFENVIKGPLRMAAITTAKYFMPHLLGTFITQYPEVRPILKVTNRSRVLERLKSNEDDLLIIGQIPAEFSVEAYPFIKNELVVVASTLHPLTRCSSITLQQLSKERFLVREAGSGTRLAVERLFAEQGIKIEPYMDLGSSEAIKQAVMANLGISVLSRYNLQLELAGNYIAVLDVKGFPLYCSWYAVHLKSKKLSLVPRAFLNFLLQQSKEILPHISNRPSDTTQSILKNPIPAILPIPSVKQTTLAASLAND